MAQCAISTTPIQSVPFLAIGQNCEYRALTNHVLTMTRMHSHSPLQPQGLVLSFPSSPSSASGPLSELVSDMNSLYSGRRIDASIYEADWDEDPLRPSERLPSPPALSLPENVLPSFPPKPPPIKEQPPSLNLELQGIGSTYDSLYRCHIESCQSADFSSASLLLQHENECHGRYGPGDNCYICVYEGCERAVHEKGFLRLLDLRDHMKRVHNDHGDASRLSIVSHTAQHNPIQDSVESLPRTSDNQESKKLVDIRSSGTRRSKYHDCPDCDESFTQRSRLE